MSRPRIILINANRMKPPVAPLALDYIGDGLISSGYDIELIDLSFDDPLSQHLGTVLTGPQPVAIGVSFRNTDDCYLFSQASFIDQLTNLCHKLREISKVPIVLGGCGFNLFPLQLIRDSGADFGVIGDGEETFEHLVYALENGTGYRKLPGLLYRDSQNQVLCNPPQYKEQLVVPTTRGLIDNCRYFQQGGMGNLETKRGCPHACIYCADPVAKGRSTRCRSPEQVVAEIKALLNQGVDVLHICDGEFNIPPQHAADVCQAIIDAGLGKRIRWYCYASIHPFPSELAELMRQAGCVGINFGADSGCDRMLTALGRNYRADDIRRVVSACHRAGLIIMLDMLIGGPGENQDSLRESIELIKQVNPHRAGAATGLRIYPGTPLADMVRKQGSLPDNPHLQGCLENNDDFYQPIFYLDQQLGDEPTELISTLIAGDQRFFPPPRREETANYNYNDNRPLEQAIANGHRGAFWDILRRAQENLPPL